MGFLEWLQATWVGKLVAESLWGYPLLETVHSIGMAMMIGSLGLINLRVLGYKPELPSPMFCPTSTFTSCTTPSTPARTSRSRNCSWRRSSLRRD